MKAAATQELSLPVRPASFRANCQHDGRGNFCVAQTGRRFVVVEGEATLGFAQGFDPCFE
jgi:hypothetical protein